MELPWGRYRRLLLLAELSGEAAELIETLSALGVETRDADGDIDLEYWPGPEEYRECLRLSLRWPRGSLSPGEVLAAAAECPAVHSVRVL